MREANSEFAIQRRSFQVLGLAGRGGPEGLERTGSAAAALLELLRDLRTPFGGVKASGLGREGGFDALEFFTEPQNICIKL